MRLERHHIVQDFSWVWGIVGITLILVGLELLSLNSESFAKTIKTKEDYTVLEPVRLDMENKGLST